MLRPVAAFEQLTRFRVHFQVLGQWFFKGFIGNVVDSCAGFNCTVGCPANPASVMRSEDVNWDRSLMV